MNTVISKTESEAAYKEYIPEKSREIIELRGRSIKHYSTGVGRRQAVVYGEPVHFRNESGQWEEIDNRFVRVKDENGENAYRTHRNEYQVQFAQASKNTNRKRCA